MKIIKVENKYPLTILTKIRDRQSLVADLRLNLYELGSIAGQKIVEEFLIEESVVTTPMQMAFHGLQIASPINIVISTKDDYEYFGKGISKVIKSFTSGYIDYAGARGKDILTEPIREIVLEQVPSNQSIDNVIIAKSVMATGCTAISLVKSAIRKLQPNRLIIVSAFYSLQGIREILNEIPNAKILCFGEPDELDNNNYLIPGVGNLDERLKESA